MWELHLAARDGDAEGVAAALVAGANVNHHDMFFPHTPLNLAAEAGSKECVRLLLAAGADASIGGALDSWAPLLKASQNGHAAVVALLLAAHGVDVNQATNDGRTPLLLASQNGHTEVVALLLAVPDVDVNQATSDGSTPLLRASSFGHAGVVALLLAAPSVAVNQAITDDGSTPLYMAAWHGHAEVVALLLAAPGVDVNQATTTDGRTPLLWASRHGHTAVVTLLLADGRADVNRADSDGTTPLCAAASSGHAAVVERLVADARTEVNTQPHPFDSAMSAQCFDAVACLLASPRLDPARMREAAAEPAVMRSACWAGCTQTVLDLLNAGADLGALSLVWLPHDGAISVSQSLLHGGPAARARVRAHVQGLALQPETFELLSEMAAVLRFGGWRVVLQRKPLLTAEAKSQAGCDTVADFVLPSEADAPAMCALLRASSHRALHAVWALRTAPAACGCVSAGEDAGSDRSVSNGAGAESARPAKRLRLPGDEQPAGEARGSSGSGARGGDCAAASPVCLPDALIHAILRLACDDIGPLPLPDGDVADADDDDGGGGGDAAADDDGGGGDDGA